MNERRLVPPIAFSLVLVFALLASRLPLRTAVEIGGDEGLELARAGLLLRGHHLYSEIWDDQPPLYPSLLALALRAERAVGPPAGAPPSPLLPRLLTAGFAVLLLGALFFLALRLGGLLAAAIAPLLVIGSPGFLSLGCSCMQEIPAYALALAALCPLVAEAPRRPGLRVALSGALFGLALAIKLIAATLIPLALLLLLLQRREGGSRGRALVSVLVLAAALVAAHVGTSLLLDGGTYLRHLRQPLLPHFVSRPTPGYGSPGDHPFPAGVFLRKQNLDLLLFSLVGIAAAARRARAAPSGLLPAALLGLALALFVPHRPWWPFYQVHLFVLLCWCAATGLSLLLRRAAARRLVPTALAALCAAATLLCMGSRVGQEVAAVRRGPQVDRSPVLAAMAPFLPCARWIYANPAAYAFHAGVPVPPPLAVVTQKRMWSGELDDARFAEEMRRYRPELVLLRNERGLWPFQDLLDSEYRVLYQDDRVRLHLRSSVRCGHQGPG